VDTITVPVFVLAPPPERGSGVRGRGVDHSVVVINVPTLRVWLVAVDPATFPAFQKARHDGHASPGSGSPLPWLATPSTKTRFLLDEPSPMFSFFSMDPPSKGPSKNRCGR